MQAPQIKPISYLKANTAEALCTVTAIGDPLYITQNGEARVVAKDIHTYEKTPETLALLKILATGESEVMKGETVPAGEAREPIGELVPQAQRFPGAHAAVSNPINFDRHLARAEHYRELRVSAFNEWETAVA